ncbi:IS30 family transposase [Staphylococcus aureus]|nr:IS30 family transposase [Staphylococcus aureus]
MSNLFHAFVKKEKDRNLKKTRGKFNIGRPISQRPKEIKKRNTFGHWEADTIVSSRGKSKGCIATSQKENHVIIIVYLCLIVPSNSMETAINNLIKHLPKGAVKTITVDRGKEFSCYQNIENQFNINVYFADPYSAWQRGTNENTNGLLRDFSLRKQT